MELTEEQLAGLRAVVKSGIYDSSVSARAQIVLWYHEGHRKTEIAKLSGASRPTIDLWLGRYAKYGADGLVNRPSPGGKSTIPGRIRGRVLALTRQTPPWQQGTFISKDPALEEKVRDVTDLYSHPPDGEAVVSADVKSGIQALERTQPLLPVGFGKSEKRTHA